MKLELPNDAVPAALYRRHLGLPACAELDERVETLAEGARRWFAEHAEPFATSHEAGIQRIVYDVIHLQIKLRLAARCWPEGVARAGVDRLIVVD